MLQSSLSPNGLHALWGAIPEEQASLDEAQRRNHQARDADRRGKRKETKEHLRKGDRRRERERWERNGEEVGSDIESTTDDEGNTGGHSPLPDESPVMGQSQAVVINVDALPPPPLGASPTVAIRSSPLASSGARLFSVRHPGSTGK